MLQRPKIHRPAGVESMKFGLVQTYKTVYKGGMQISFEYLWCSPGCLLFYSEPTHHAHTAFRLTSLPFYIIGHHLLWQLWWRLVSLNWHLP